MATPARVPSSGSSELQRFHRNTDIHDEAGILTDLLNTGDRGVVVVNGDGFGSGRDQPSGASPFEQFLVGLSNLVERSHVPAVD